MSNISLLSTLNLGTIDYSSSNKVSTIEKEKNDSFENLISSKISEQKAPIAEISNEPIKVESSTQSLYDDIISLLKTGFTVGELKDFEERLKAILKMKDDKKTSINEIEAALKKLNMEILEAKKRVTGQVVKKSDDNVSQLNSTTTQEATLDFDSVVNNIKNMLKDIKDNSKSINIDDEDEINNKEYAKLKLLLKMS
jgi:uncharacterized protein YukE